ncbi:MAG: FecR domain-containing protein [Alphaproteobacteria bacterium]
MLKYIIIPVLAVLLLTGAPRSYAAAPDNPVIGTILKVEGKVALRLAGHKDAVAAAAQTHIHMRDVIETSKKSRAFILFIDNTQITLSENTKLTVDEYVFNPDNTAENKGDYRILQGSFQYLSGLIAKRKDPDVNIDTPHGSIGIRGTTFWGGNLGGGYGFYVKDGKIIVFNAGGNAKVNENEGTIVLGDAPPGPPGAWSQEDIDKMNDSIAFKDGDDLPGLIGGHKGKQKDMIKKFKEWLKKHHNEHGENDEPDTEMKDLPMDETGEPDLVPFSPDGGGRFGGGN